LDNEDYPALIVSRKSGYILSINLPAFELLAIDAVGFQVIEFVADQEAYQQMIQQLQPTGADDHAILFRNADGYLICCQVTATIAPAYSEWMIIRFTTC
jgi:hypothetical protein